MQIDRIHESVRLLDAHAARTGLEGGSGDPARRYVWTDAFAVLASVGVAGVTGELRHLARAMRIADLVHRHLGRHRADDVRSGWISGRAEADGALHPTAGGLRIGKSLPERGPGERFDAVLEWERDGQYFHYLTRWMDALRALSAASGDAEWEDLAVELALAAHRGFVVRDPTGRPVRIAWKMSIDLSRPQIAASGLHDPLDGLVSMAQLRAAVRRREPGFTGLDAPIDDMLRLCARIEDWATTDPLGVGGLLLAGAALHELDRSGELAVPLLADRVVSAAERGLRAFVRGAEVFEHVQARLAFRELGLVIGLRAWEGRDPFVRHQPLAERIESAWLDPVAQRTPGWEGHLDINQVMLAAALVPEACLAGAAAATSRERWIRVISG
jgi:hypothetical protein